jgi:hypothetical protein
MNSYSPRRPGAIAKALQRTLVVLTACLFLLQIPSFAQTSTVYGTITDRNGKPVVNVLVVIGQNYRYTDVSGRYKIAGVPVGRQHMVCRRGSAVLWQGDVDISGAEMLLNRKLN